MDQRSAAQRQDAEAKAKKPAYETPEVMVMNETEVLKVFQITSAGISWWG